MNEKQLREAWILADSGSRKEIEDQLRERGAKSDEDHFYGAWNTGGGRGALKSAAQQKAAAKKFGKATHAYAQNKINKSQYTKEQDEYRAKNLAIPQKLASAKEYKFASKGNKATFEFQGEKFNVTGIHPRGYVQSLRKAAQTALRKNQDNRAKKATDLMKLLNKQFDLGY